MRILTSLCLSVAFALPLGLVGPEAGGCDPLGNVQFVCNQVGPEDLVSVPGGEWVVASGDAANGAIRLIRVRDLTTTVLFPTAGSKERPDSKTYDSCPGPIDPAEKDKFRAHGLALRPGRNSVHTLYVVHHGNRESIEVFDLDARPKLPTLTWVGCAIAPEQVGLNSVVPLPEGGFAASNYLAPGDTANRDHLFAGENNGELWDWHTGKGWKIIPGSEASGANGIEISKDGKWIYYAGWGSRTFIRLSRGLTPVKKDMVPLGFRVDNIRWTPDGSLLAAGQGGPDTALFGRGRAAGPGGTSNVVKINPNTLQFQEIINYPFNETFAFSTVALQVGKEIWVGSVRGDRIARFPAPASR